MMFSYKLKWAIVITTIKEKQGMSNPEMNHQNKNDLLTRLSAPLLL